MDQVLSYLNRPLVTQYFVSNSPSSSLLLWAPKNCLSAFKCLTTRNYNSVPHDLEQTVLWNLKRAALPVYQALYHLDNNNITIILTGHKIVEGNIDDPKTAEKLAQYIGLPFEPESTQKPPNKPEMIKDAFHYWSRMFFRNTVKTDIDALAIQDNMIVRILEIKRSPNVPVGKWTPYEEDQNNYVLQAALARHLKVPLKVIHHTTAPNSSQPLSSDIKVDLFEYFPEENKDFDFEQFRSEKNRKVVPLALAI